ncbi:hypothetical protein [Agrococcus versicolor]
MYAGQAVTSSDRVAIELLAYAKSLADRGAVDVVSIPIVGDGGADSFDLLVGAGIAIGVGPVADPLTEVVGADLAIDDLRERQARLVGPRRDGS